MATVFRTFLSRQVRLEFLWLVRSLFRTPLLDRKTPRLPPLHLIGRVLIHRELEGLRLNQLGLGIESRPLRTSPRRSMIRAPSSTRQVQGLVTRQGS